MTGRQSQCLKCHRWLTGSPTPEVGHQGQAGGTVCSLTHHPSPCPFKDENGVLCSFYEQQQYEENAAAAAATAAAHSSDVLTAAPPVSSHTEAAQLHLQQQLLQMQQERDAERRQVELLQMSNHNLRETQARLGQLPVMSSSLTTTTSTVSSSFCARMMGTGFSQSLVTPSPSFASSISSFPASLHSAASALAAGNVPPPPPPATIYGYQGPSIPQLRSDPNVSGLANQVVSLLMREIPALSSAPVQPVASQLPVSFSSHPGSALPSFPGSVGQAPPAAYPAPAGPYPAAFSLPAAIPAAASPAPSLHHLLPPSIGVPAPSYNNQSQQQIDELQRRIDGLRAQQVQGGFHGQVQGSTQVSRSSLDSLLNATIKCAQYRASDFAKIGNFSYSNQIKQNNLNLSLFSYGSIRHLLALADGTLPPVSKEEYISRLQHLCNVYEITCLGSNLTDFDGYGWKVAREYDNKILRDLEHGFKKWHTLDRAIDPTSWTVAKELIPKTKQASQTSKSSNSNGQQKLCTTWNSCRQEGCQWEVNNHGQNCIFLHYCSRCRSKGQNRKHKLWQCTEPEPARTSAPPASSGPPTAVTSA